VKQPSSEEIFAHLRALGVSLPARADARGAYDLVVVHDGIARISGQLPRLDSTGTIMSGRLEAGGDLALAREAAKLCFGRALLALHQEIGDLVRIERLIYLRGFINSSPEFDAHGAVMDAASELAITLLGDRGRHARSALGVSSLPSSGLVEIELTAAIRPS
jgi:enamine deaminase RidA (YjgF/YER057c/UK114 family)